MPIYHGKPGAAVILDDSERPSEEITPAKTPANRRQSGASDSNFIPTPLIMNNIEQIQ